MKCYGCCGSGNFLVIAYRELRKLELQAMDALRDLEGGASLAFGFSSVISLSKFYGIEYADFAAETAKLALWIAEYQQNARFIAAFGAEIPALPLKDSANIVCGNALRIDWKVFCHIDSNESSDIYIVSNPPYLGSRNMEPSQKEDMKLVFKSYTNKFNSMDYVCAWFLRCAEFTNSEKIKFALVATNSICQGLHATLIWPILFDFGIEPFFAHKSFKWSNNAANKAGVTCVIIGFRKASSGKKYLFSGTNGEEVENINRYLANAEDVSVSAAKSSLSSFPEMLFGNMPRDGGGLILSPDEVDELLNEEPSLKQFIRGFLGSQEFIKGSKRFCLWFEEEQLNIAKSYKVLEPHLLKVTRSRLQSPAESTRNSASRPHRFTQIQSVARDHSIIIPSVTSERREYIPVGVLTEGEIISNLAFAIYDSPLFYVSILSSKLHICWVRAVCGQLETRIRYSNTLGWNTFPFPPISDEAKDKLDKSARRILLTREKYFPKTIAELYDPDDMPQELRSAHLENDKLVETIFCGREFENEDERLKALFEMYVELSEGKRNV
ncbi:class I SAM-dependent DNA methyltransferase [Alteromonas profundi]